MNTTDPAVARNMTDSRVEFQVEWLTAELAVWKAEQKRRRDLAAQAEIAKNPLKIGDRVKTRWESRNGLAAKTVTKVNPKSVGVESRFYQDGERVPLSRIVWAQRDGVDIDLTGLK